MSLIGGVLGGSGSSGGTSAPTGTSGDGDTGGASSATSSSEGSGGGYNSASNSGSSVNAAAGSESANRNAEQMQQVAARSGDAETRNSDAASERSVPVEPLEAPARSPKSSSLDAQSTTTLLDIQENTPTRPERLAAARTEQAQTLQSISQSILEQAGISTEPDQNKVNLYEGS